MRNRNTLLLVICICFANSVYADSGWTEYVPVEEVNPTARHYYTFQLPVSHNPSRCKNKTGFYQDYTALGADKMFHTLLEALVSRNRVRAYVTGRCNLDGYSEISSVSIKR